MSWIMVDIEADGLIPGDYSMVCFGAVVVEPGLERTFYGELQPISEKFVPEALAGGSAYLQMHHQRGIVAGVAAGAAEIQLNIIASDVLGLPREPR